MSADYQAKQIYDAMIGDITESSEKWKEMCRLAGHIYRYEFDNILLILAQRPHATLVADFDTWKKVDRYVKRGSKGIAIFPSRVLKPSMHYVFDISDTGGKNQKLTWSLEGENLRNYLDFLVSKGQMGIYDGTNRETQINSLKFFTQTYIRDIIKEDFEERLSELKQLTGCVIKEFDEETQELTVIEELLENSILYTVGTRCGFDLSLQEQDFSQIVNYSEEEVVYRLGSLVCDVSCSVLKDFSRNIKLMESERRVLYGRDDIHVPRSGRTDVSGYQGAGREGNETGKSREVRIISDEVSKGERTGPVQPALPFWEAGGEDAGSKRGSIPVTGPADERLSPEEQTKKSRLYHGDVEDKGTGEDAGGGNRTSSDRIQVPLDENNDNFNKELDEINSFGRSREADYQQVSLFFDEVTGQIGINPHLQSADDLQEMVPTRGENNQNRVKYTYMAPKKERTVPHKYVVETLLKGSGFQGGKKRIFELFQTVSDSSERSRLIKKEYGLGGAGWPIDGYGLHGYDSFKAQGLRFQWRDEEGEKEGYVSWINIEREIGALILTGEYYQQSVESMDEVEEHEDSVLANEKLTDEEIEVNLEEDRHRADERYEKDVMEKDLQDCLEIYLRDCSSIKPFSPFLKMVHEASCCYQIS